MRRPPSASIWRDTEDAGSGVGKYWDDMNSLLHARAAQIARPAPTIVVEVFGRNLAALAVIPTRATDQPQPEPESQQNRATHYHLMAAVWAQPVFPVADL